MQYSTFRAHGKWLIFRNLEDINDTWCVVREGVISGHLGAVAAKCSTLRYDPLCHGAGPKTTGRISVFTNEDDYIEVGMKLIHLNVVQHDIKYKTVAATLDRKFAFNT